MKNKIKRVLAHAPTIIGLLGFIFGAYQYAQIKQIRERAGSPFFEVEWINYDASDDYIQLPEKYVYSEHPSKLSATLHGIIHDTSTPPDYPDKYPLGLGIKNVGSKIKIFRVSSNEEVVLKKHERNNDYYRLNYFHAKPPSKLRFKLFYETFDGIQGVQVWELTRGSNVLKRIKPKTP